MICRVVITVSILWTVTGQSYESSGSGDFTFEVGHWIMSLTLLGILVSVHFSLIKLDERLNSFRSTCM